MVNGVDAPLEIDEDLHSRQASLNDFLFLSCLTSRFCTSLRALTSINSCSVQLAVYGKESMRRMATANVLIIGLNGLGCEIGELLNSK